MISRCAFPTDLTPTTNRLGSQAVRLTAEAARRLARARAAGRVHSVFARTVNVALDGLSETGWLSLHGPGPIPSPFGIACEIPPVRQARAGAVVRFEPEALLVDGAPSIRLDRAFVHDTALPPTAPPPSVPACLAWAFPGITDGLLPTAAAVLGQASLPPSSLARVAAPALGRLSRATTAGDAAGCLAAALPLLGLGPGLTPSGDDCLVGWLTGAWVASGTSRRLVEAIGSDLLAAASDRTGALSRAFLAATAIGQVAEPVHAFVAMPNEARLSALLALGATSGSDLLAGYLLARHALALSGSLSRAGRALRSTRRGASRPFRTSPRRGCAARVPAALPRVRARSGTQRPRGEETTGDAETNERGLRRL